jgi:hypothetical protein
MIRKSEYFAALKGWPVWIVESWDEPFRYNRFQLEQKYQGFGLSQDKLIELSKSVIREIGQI